MRKKKEFDCVTFKYKMAAQAWKRSGAKTIDEYFDFLSAAAKDPSLYEKHESKSKLRQEC